MLCSESTNTLYPACSKKCGLSLTLDFARDKNRKYGKHKGGHDMQQSYLSGVKWCHTVSCLPEFMHVKKHY